MQESRRDDESVGGEAARWYECLCGGEQCVAEGCQSEKEGGIESGFIWLRWKPRWFCWKAEVPMRYLE